VFKNNGCRTILLPEALFSALSLVIASVDERKTGEAASLKRIMVPLDGSTLAELVLPEAEELARKMDLEMVLVRAYAVPTPLYTAETYTYNIQELWDQISKEAEDYLAEKVRQLQAQGVKTVSAMPVAGVAAEKIIDLAREKTASLVAMCTHGRTGVGRWVMGSVTERVVRHSDNPVLVIRAASGSPNPSS
jgi:nucleotide-binding universal stress UspA family protein